MPQNVGSTGEDLIGNNIQSRRTEFCKADRTSWKLTLQDINTTPKEPKTERDCNYRQLFPYWKTSFKIIYMHSNLRHWVKILLLDFEVAVNLGDTVFLNMGRICICYLSFLVWKWSGHPSYVRLDQHTTAQDCFLGTWMLHSNQAYCRSRVLLASSASKCS